MGLFSKISEMIKRSKTPKLNAGNNEQQYQNQYQGVGNNGYPYTIKLSNNGEKLRLRAIQQDREVTHRNGEKTKLMIAKVVRYKEDEAIFDDQEKSVAFEIPKGAQINDVILQKIGQYYMYEGNMPDNNKDCMYLGKISQDPYDLGTNNKSEVVRKYIDENIAPKIAREKQEQIERETASYIERENKKNREFNQKMYEEQKKYERQKLITKNERMKNPYLKKLDIEHIARDGKKYCDYDGIDVLNGDILRLRRMNKFGKDENGTYLYTGYINTTRNEDDTEFFSEDENPSGMPVCFATDKKIEEIIQSNNSYDLRNFLEFLSKAKEYTNDNGYLNYIGYISQYNGKTDMNISRTMQENIEKLQKKFYQNKVQGQQINQIGNQQEY